MTRNRILYSQNFLVSKNLINRLIDLTGITPEETVLDIGAGQGTLTKELAGKAKRVLAYEIDPVMYGRLFKNVAHMQNVELIHEDFLNAELPDYEYNVFANIPFNITAEIIKKLTNADNPPKRTFLMIQLEASKKYIGDPKETLTSIMLHPWYTIEIAHNFSSRDFYPIPNVDIVLLKILKKSYPDIPVEDRQQYNDFIVYAFKYSNPSVEKGLRKLFSKQEFNRASDKYGIKSDAKPAHLTYDQWLGLYTAYTFLDNSKKRFVKNAEKKLQEEQGKIVKIHRTRVNKDWKETTE